MRSILTLSIALFSFYFLSCSSKKSDEIKPTVGAITESIYASGVIKSEDQYTVFPTVSGIMQKQLVAVGASVVKGQNLFLIDNDKASLNTENARLAYELSKASNHYIQDKIADMEAKVQMAKDKLALDASVYNRNKNIKQYNVISEVDYEKVEWAYKNSKSNLESLQKQLAQLKVQLSNEQKRNAINVQLSEKAQSDYTIKSAFSGTLYDVLVKEGALVSPQTPLAIVGKKNAFVIELDVDENDMVHVAVGKKALITLDSYRGTVFEALVDKIYPIMDERSRTFKIEAHFLTPPPKLYPNLTVEANLIIQTKKNVMTIPRSYVINDTYVLVGSNQKRKIKIGLSDYQNVEVLGGLHANETLYKPQ
ncbi:CusB/HlyD membrane fusion family barrel-sandwich protein [Flavobacterium aciduliphilum]|uniref:CusB/HlyD membrane fusion family barrel-sandwich protein n=2 Tax=Flavobacterium aciduliphilum TaxID=1101402 RepID=A0A328YAP1_9FLAO|nr:CusB/HlyD membrane fusion family barrel-sandwich protein [Flavobacterium aciduliphilum]